MRIKGLKRTRPAFVGVALVMLLGIGMLGGAAVKGQAATTQQVTAELLCQPATVKPGNTVGCTLTVTNLGGNNVTKVVVTDDASGGKFLSSSQSSRCTIKTDTQLSCDIGKLTAVGTGGSSFFTETHELQVPSTGISLGQTVTGRYSPNPNNRASDIITPTPFTVRTSLDDDANFDGTFANANEDSVQTDGISALNPYSTGATVLGATFAAGLTVREQNAEDDDLNCPPNGCFGGQVIQFDITPLVSTFPASFPASFTLTATISGNVIPNGTKAGDIVVTHKTATGVFTVPDCGSIEGTDEAGACIVSKTINPKTKIATIKAQGPGTGNGGWGFG